MSSNSLIIIKDEIFRLTQTKLQCHLVTLSNKNIQLAYNLCLDRHILNKKKHIITYLSTIPHKKTLHKNVIYYLSTPRKYKGSKCNNRVAIQTNTIIYMKSELIVEHNHGRDHGSPLHSPHRHKGHNSDIENVAKRPKICCCKCGIRNITAVVNVVHNFNVAKKAHGP